MMEREMTDEEWEGVWVSLLIIIGVIIVIGGTAYIGYIMRGS